MNPSTRSLLEKFDDSEQVEMPQGFRYREQIERVSALRSRLERMLQMNLELDLHVEDASYFTSLAAVVASIDESMKYESFAIRFSNFGDMYIVYGDAWDGMSIEKQNALRNEIEATGFVFIDEEQLHEIYDGVNESLKRSFPSSTWFTRFFDYI